MSSDKALPLLLAGASVLEALTGSEPYLAPRRQDEADRVRLRRGEAEIGGLVLSGGPTRLWHGVAKEDRRTGLALNSLRFVDPLRRGERTADDAETWLAFVRGWREWSSEARALGWDSFLPAGQRAVVLAAGLRDFWPNERDRPADVVDLLGEHLGVFLDKLRTGRVHLVEETLLRGCAALSIGPRPDQDRASILGEFAERYLVDDLAPGGGIGSVTHMTRRWTGLYRAVHAEIGEPAGLTEPDVLSQRTEAELSRLWIHGTVPSGGLFAAGTVDAQAEWAGRAPASAAERYCASGSDAGEASDDLTYVNRSGWTFARRGWGETELDFRDETFLALRSGRLESSGREDDNTALWLTARGVTWIGDHPSDLGTGWDRRDRHSSVELDGRYRTLSDTEVTRSRVTAACFDFELRDRAYLPISLVRRVVYSRSGDFVLVIDQSRSADEHTGRQNWMIPPGISVDTSRGSARLVSGEEACEIRWLSVPAPEPTVEELEDGWKRVTVSFAGSSHRLITAILPQGAQEDVRCQRTPLADGAVSVSVRRPKHAEQLVVCKEGAGVGAVDEDAESLAERVAVEALNGGLSPEEENTLRRQLRSRIGEVKHELHAHGSGPKERVHAIGALQRIADDLSVSGLRDFGLGAALIDVASADLREMVSGHRLVAGKKRSPLISWDESSRLVHEFYGVPIRTHTAVTADLDPKLERQMLTVDFGQLVLPLLLSTLEEGRTLRVMFHGATDRSRNALPRFERMRSMEAGSSGPVLFISDPCLDLDASQILTWYAGDEELNLHAQIARQVEALAGALGCDRILYIGNSGGGNAALQCASYSEGAAVVTFNPQIQVDRYVPRVARTAQEGLFGRPSVADDPALRSRMDLIARYQEIGFEKRVFFIQNTGDEMHFEHHFRPFSEAWAAGGRADDFEALTPYLGPGHRVPPPDEYMALVEQGERFVFGG